MTDETDLTYEMTSEATAELVIAELKGAGYNAAHFQFRGKRTDETSHTVIVSDVDEAMKGDVNALVTRLDPDAKSNL